MPKKWGCEDMSDSNDLKFRYYIVIIGHLVLAKEFFDIPIDGRMRAKIWMKSGCTVLLPSLEDVMLVPKNLTCVLNRYC